MSTGLAIVTGAGSGIGRASAIMLASKGYAVAAIDLDLSSARETVKGLAHAGAYQANVSESAQLDAAVTAAIGELGPLEVMFNNAASSTVISMSTRWTRRSGGA
jgi:NAD(P)-dependent dehydrogenase (short-subunit alcohol dehydrogenase family)